MPVNQVYKATGEKIIDISDSTVTAANLAEGETAYNASGELITGTMQGGLEMNVKFAEGSKEIPSYMFYNNHGLGSTNETYPIAEVVIGNGVWRIGDYAFRYCTTLTSVTIPDSVKTIGRLAFHSCSSLPNITIPDSVTYIDAGAFHSCSSLPNITIPDSVIYIGDGAFSKCTNLKTITINKPQGSISGAPWGATGATIIWTG